MQKVSEEILEAEMKFTEVERLSLVLVTESKIFLIRKVLSFLALEFNSVFSQLNDV